MAFVTRTPLPLSFPILYDQRRLYSNDENTTTVSGVRFHDSTQSKASIRQSHAAPQQAAASPALSGEAWLRRIEDVQASPAGVGESWLRDEEQGDCLELLELLEPLQVDVGLGPNLGPEPSRRERRLSSEWREAMSARARQRFHAQPQAASAKKPSASTPYPNEAR